MYIIYAHNTGEEEEKKQKKKCTSACIIYIYKRIVCVCMYLCACGMTGFREWCASEGRLVAALRKSKENSYIYFAWDIIRVFIYIYIGILCLWELTWWCTNMYKCKILYIYNFFIYIYFVSRSSALAAETAVNRRTGGGGLAISFWDLKYELLGKTGHSDRRPAVCPHTHESDLAHTPTPVSAGKRHISRFAGYARARFFFSKSPRRSSRVLAFLREITACRIYRWL